MRQNLSHTIWECKYHIVCIPKNRRKILYGKLRIGVGTILRKLCEYKKLEVIEGKACIDHIHLCVSIPPKYAVSTIVGYLKGKSAMIMFEKYSELKKNFRGHSFWARGYFAASSGNITDEVIMEYIDLQSKEPTGKDFTVSE